MRYTSGGGRPIGTNPKADDPNAQIAVKLKALYQSVQEEAVPDRFIELLERLESAERQSVLQGKE